MKTNRKVHFLILIIYVFSLLSLYNTSGKNNDRCFVPFHFGIAKSKYSQMAVDGALRPRLSHPHLITCVILLSSFLFIYIFTPVNPYNTSCVADHMFAFRRHHQFSRSHFDVGAFLLDYCFACCFMLLCLQLWPDRIV